MIKGGDRIMRTESGLSKALERSMNNQCRFMTLEECLRNETVVDKLDDERRDKAHKNTKWHINMTKCFEKRLEEFLAGLYILIPEENINIGKEIMEDLKNHNETYFKNLNDLEEKELYFEEQSDNTREYMKAYTKKAMELSRLESSEVEKKMMEEALMTRLGK